MSAVESLRVRLSSDVYSACLSHAMSTEKEEIMGLLIGEIRQQSDPAEELANEVVLEIVGLKILQRLDKRKDRVEIRQGRVSCVSCQL